MKIGSKLAHLMNYKQLFYEQRIAIYILLTTGLNQAKIAELIGVCKSTVSREIKRNTGLKGYRPIQAHQRAFERRQNAEKHIRFTDEIKTTVKKYLEQEWSPEQICGRLKKENKPSVSHETIYQFIIDDQKNGGELYKHLRLGRKKRRKRIKKENGRGQIPNRVSIDERPAIVDAKERVGDWELDTIIGKNHKGAIVTAVERKTKFSCMKHVPKKEASLVAKALIDMLKPYGNLVHTLTADNGKEFSEHVKVADALKAKFYFAHPYSSWERGLNENTNGLIRQYFPKKTCLLNVSDDYILIVQDKLNDRPRKTLNFETPNHLFLNSVVALET
jgi:transposase, IS30 family